MSSHLINLTVQEVIESINNISVNTDELTSTLNMVKYICFATRFLNGFNFW